MGGKATRASGGSHADGTTPLRQTTYVQNDLAIRGDVGLIGPDSDLTLDGRPLAAPISIEALAHQPGVARWRAKLAKARSGGSGALSVIILMIGDSRARSSASKYRNAYPDLLRRRFLGSTPGGGYGVLPASEGSFNGVTDGDWPGGDNPWTYTGSIGTQVTFGIGYHAVSIPAAGTATLTYFGDKVDLIYVRTADGPTAATVTLDGTSVGPLNARGSQAAGQRVGYGTNGNFGHHTIVITPNDGPLVLEGGQWYDNETPFFIVGTVQIIDASHAGFGFKDWNAGNTEWSAQLTGADAFMGMCVTVLGANDLGANPVRTTTQVKDDYVSLIRQIDTRLGTTALSHLAVWLPGSQTIPTLPYVAALRQAAAEIGLDRVAVADLAALRPGRLFGSDLSADESHPSDAGHIWVAEQLGQLLDPTPTTTQPVTQRRTIIDASTPADSRLNWTEAWTGLTIGGYDASASSGVSERRHRMWLDPGTYRATVTNQHGTTRGTCEVLIGRWNNNTPTLTSCGTVATDNGGADTDVTTRLGTTVTTDIPGWHVIVVRRTTATTGVIRLRQLVIDKTTSP